MTSIVQTTINELRRGLGPGFSVDFVNTGGGCMAIEVHRVDHDGLESSYVLITDGEDIFSPADLTSDRGVCGFMATYRADWDADPEELYWDYAHYVGDEYDDAEHVDNDPTDTVTHTVAGRRSAVLSFVPALVRAVVDASDRL